MFKSIIKFITNIFTKKVEVKVVEKVVVVEVLSQGAFERLAKGLPNPIITSSDTAHTTAQKLGVQLALAELRTKFVV